MEVPLLKAQLLTANRDLSQVGIHATRAATPWNEAQRWDGLTQAPHWHWVTGLWDSVSAQFVDCETSWESFRWENDRGQDMLPPNMAPWQVDCFKLKVQEDLLTFPWSRLEDPHVRGAFLTHREEPPYLQSGWDSERTLSKQALLCVPSLVLFTDTLLVLSHFPMILYLSSTLKALIFNRFFGFHFLR